MQEKDTGWTEFQIRCRALAELLVAERGLTLELARHRDGYLSGLVRPTKTPVELYIYEDEVGWTEGDLWWICEYQDYPTPQGMLDGFEQKFSASLGRQLPKQ